MNTTTLEDKNKTSNNIKSTAGYIYVDDGGSGGLPVVFAHSFGGSTQHWEPQLKYLRKNRRALALDLRGHGNSASPANLDYDVNSIADDIAAVVDSLKLDRFILVGHSMGGSAAIAYAGKNPDRVAGLLMAGTPGKTPADQAKMVIASLESDKYEQVMEDYMKKLLVNAKPEVDKLEREGMSKIPREANISIIKAVFNYDPLPVLRQYPGHTLIVSKSTEEQPNSLHSAFPNIAYKTVEGTSHWIQLDKPEEFNRILDEFIKTVEADK